MTAPGEAVEHLTLRERAHGQGFNLPEVATLGMQRGEWPLRLFVSDLHAVRWFEENPAARRLWQVRLDIECEMAYVPPVAGKLVPQ